MFKIMTLNINAYGERHGPWPARIGLIREAISDACPDVIALQAVRQEPGLFDGKDQATQISDILKQDYPYAIYQPGMCYTDHSTDGSAFISRLPLADVSQVSFDVPAGTADNIQRVLLHARVDLDGGPVHVFNAHISWVLDQARQNMAQVLPLLRSFSGQAVLVGDFNHPPEAELFSGLREMGWIDAWAAQRPSEDGFTFFEAGNLVKRIDYVWVTPDLRPKIVEIRIVAGAEASLKIRPSDHTGLLAAFVFQSGALTDCTRV